MQQQVLSGTRAFPLIDPGAHEQGSGIPATAANAVKPFYHLPQPHQTDRSWSARSWAATRQGWVFLSSTEDARAAIQRLQGVWLDSLLRRKRGLAVVMGFRSVSQLRSIYGRDGAITLTSSPTTKVILRCD